MRICAAKILPCPLRTSRSLLCCTEKAWHYFWFTAINHFRRRTVTHDTQQSKCKSQAGKKKSRTVRIIQKNCPQCLCEFCHTNIVDISVWVCVYVCVFLGSHNHYVPQWRTKTRGFSSDQCWELSNTHSLKLSVSQTDALTFIQTPAVKNVVMWIVFVCVAPPPSQTHCQTVRLKRSDSLGRRKPSCIIETSQRLNCITNVSLHSKAPSLCRGYLNWCFTPENSPNLMLVSIRQARIWLSLCARTFTICTIGWCSFYSGTVLL